MHIGYSVVGEHVVTVWYEHSQYKQSLAYKEVVTKYPPELDDQNTTILLTNKHLEGINIFVALQISPAMFSKCSCT